MSRLLLLVALTSLPGIIPERPHVAQRIGWVHRSAVAKWKSWPLEAP